MEIFTACLALSLPLTVYLLLSRQMELMEKEIRELKEYNQASQDFIITSLAESDEKAITLENRVNHHQICLEGAGKLLVEDEKIMKSLLEENRFTGLKLDCLMVDFYNHQQQYYHLDSQKIPCKITDTLHEEFDMVRLEKNCKARADAWGYKIAGSRPEGL